MDSTKLPNFMIIGAMKSGTTGLYTHLAAHPHISMSREKETDFFIAERNYSRGLRWYQAQFHEAPFRGEASPNYTKRDIFPGVAARIKAQCPDIKLIYVVRDPVDRLLSQYRHTWTMGRSQIPPDELMHTDEYTHLLNTSRYAFQIEDYLNHFLKEQIMVVDFADLKETLHETVQSICTFIGADSAMLPAHSEVANSHREVAKIPTPLLRFSRSKIGRALNTRLGEGAKSLIKSLLAKKKSAQPPEFTPEQVKKITDDLREDATRFRQLSGLQFPHWKV